MVRPTQRHHCVLPFTSPILRKIYILPSSTWGGGGRSSSSLTHFSCASLPHSLQREWSYCNLHTWGAKDGVRHLRYPQLTGAERCIIAKLLLSFYDQFLQYAHR